MIGMKRNASQKRRPDFSEDEIESYREDADLMLESWDEQEPQTGEPRAMFDVGLNALMMGLCGVARTCFERALPFLLRDVGPDVPDVHDKYIAAHEPPHEDLGENVASGHVILGFDKFAESEVWLQIAMCRWFLENRHDQVSLTHSAEQWHQHFREDYPQHLWDRDTLECAGFALYAGGYDRQLLEYFSKHPAFREPKKITTLKSEPFVGWVLAKQRLEKSWSSDEIAAMWESFLRHNLPKSFEELDHESWPMWAKLAWWDTAEGTKPSPFELMMRCYEYVPGGKAPPIEW